MEKTDKSRHVFRKAREKVWKIMKLSCVFMLFFVLAMSARGMGQEQRVTLRLKQVNLYELFDAIRQQTGLQFLCNAEQVKALPAVSVDVKDKAVKDVLTEVLAGTSLTFSFDRNVVTILTRDEEPEQKSIMVKGFVYDEKKQPLPGVTVRVVETSVGTATNEKGWFALSLPMQKGKLEFSFVGYESQEIEFSSKMEDTLRVVMKEEVQALEEAVVVAYGTTNRREMTGAVSIVKADDIRGIPSPSISNLLQGRVAGMDVTNISGSPGGGGTNVTIRGYNSLSIESGRRFSNPLWVVDGVPMNSFTSPVTGTNGLADLNPEMIESIQILKDASAASLYGSRAANGVIIVTTKKGRKNQDAQFDVNFSYSYNVLPKYPKQTRGKAERDFRLKQTMNVRTAYFDEDKNMYVYPKSYEDAFNKSGAVYDGFWGNGTVENLNNGNMYQDSLNPFYNNSTNFFKYYFKAARTLNANIQTYGGSERITYSVGLGFYDEDGIMKGTGYKRVNLMGNFLFDPRSWLGVDFRTYLAYTDRSRGVRDGGFSSGNEVETIPGDPFSLSSLYPGSGAVTEKALEGLQGTQEKNTTYRLRASFGLKVKVFEGLDVNNTLSLDYTQNNRNYFAPSWIDDEKESQSTGEVARSYTLLDELLVTYKRVFLERHQLDVMLGFSYQYDQENYIAGVGLNGPSDYVHYVGSQGWPDLKDEDGYYYAMKNYESNFTEKKMESYFGRLNYTYDKKYMLSVTLRRDGSSVFGRDLRWATFPSVALAWNFSEENFFSKFAWLSFGKLRASYGVSGNQFTSPYLAYGLLEGGSTTYDGGPSIEPDFTEGYWNPELGWEETKQYDFGLDLDLLDYRLGLTFDYYYRYTDKMLSLVQMPGSHFGYSQAWRNAGALSNEGVEFEIKYDIFRRENLQWNISVNMAKNWNKLRKSYNGRDISMYSTDGRSLNYILGEPVGTILGLKTDGYIQSESDIIYLYRADGTYRALEKQYFANVFFREGDINFIDVNGDGYIDYNDNVYLGSSLPQLYGGIVNEIRWKNWDLNMLWSYSLGRDMVNAAAYESMGKEESPIFENLRDVTFWEKEGDNPTYPYLQSNNYNGSWDYITDSRIEHVNYLKVKTLTVGYTLPKDWLRKTFFRDIRLFFSGENLLTWTNYSGIDPETVDINSGYDKGTTYPLARKLTLGITIKL